MAYEESMIDKRVVKRNIAKGIVDAKELAKLTAALPDRADNAEVIGSDQDDIDDDDDEDGEA
jgi:hypothetical protein